MASKFDKIALDALHKLRDKKIEGDIILKEHAKKKKIFHARAKIENALHRNIIVDLTLNSYTEEKNINIRMDGVGPICRIDIDSQAHGQCGRNHKHYVESESCPSDNLKKGVVSAASFSGLSIKEAFERFCTLAKIQHKGVVRIDAN